MQHGCRLARLPAPGKLDGWGSRDLLLLLKRRTSHFGTSQPELADKKHLQRASSVQCALPFDDKLAIAIAIRHTQTDTPLAPGRNRLCIGFELLPPTHKLNLQSLTH